MPIAWFRAATSLAEGYRLRSSLLMALALPWAVVAQTAVPLWPKGAPDAKGTAVTDIPTLTPFTASKPNGAAMVVLPGGGYSDLVMDKEGEAPAKWLAGIGVSAFVLKYRLGSNGYRHPVEMWDAQRALRWVRANAKRFRVDPARVGIMGFSAGGHLASTASTHFDSGNPQAADTVDRQSCKPDWSILVYPVITMDPSFTHTRSRDQLLGPSPTQQMLDSLSSEKQVTSKTPPAFLIHAKDDLNVPFKNSQVYYDSLLKHGVPAELKLFDKGGHGFGLGTGNATLGTWPGLTATWMEKLGFFKEGSTGIPYRPSSGPARARTGFSGEEDRISRVRFRFRSAILDATGRNLP